MKKLYFVFGLLFILASCNLQLKCPDERLIGIWSSYHNGDGYKFTEFRYRFNQDNNICDLYFRENKYFTFISIEESPMLHYQWKIEGDKIYFLHCDSSGFKVGNSDWEESSFKYIDGSTIEIGGLIYIKE